MLLQLGAAAMDRWLAKLIGLILAFLLPFISTVLPHHVQCQVSRAERILCHLLCFAGGIFFATYLLHMAPEVHNFAMHLFSLFCERSEILLSICVKLF